MQRSIFSNTVYKSFTGEVFPAEATTGELCFFKAATFQSNNNNYNMKKNCSVLNYFTHRQKKRKE